MIRFIDDIYVSDSIKSRADTIKWRAVCGIGQVKVSFITLSESGTDIFDIYPGLVFKQRTVRKSNLVIIGIAAGQSAATDLVEHMISDALAATGDISGIRGFFEQYIADHI